MHHTAASICVLRSVWVDRIFNRVHVYYFWVCSGWVRHVLLILSLFFFGKCIYAHQAQVCLPWVRFGSGPNLNPWRPLLRQHSALNFSSSVILSPVALPSPILNHWSSHVKLSSNKHFTLIQLVLPSNTPVTHPGMQIRCFLYLNNT